MSDGHQFICRRNSHRCRRTLFLMRESFRIHPVFLCNLTSCILQMLERVINHTIFLGASHIFQKEPN